MCERLRRALLALRVFVTTFGLDLDIANGVFAGKRFFRVGFRIGRRNNHSVELGFLLVCYLENSRWIRTRIIGSVGAWLELVASQLVALRDSEVSLAACCRCLHSDNVC